MTEINKLYQQLLLPSDLLVSEMAILDEDILIPEVGGKIRPDLVRIGNIDMHASVVPLLFPYITAC